MHGNEKEFLDWLNNSDIPQRRAKNKIISPITKNKYRLVLESFDKESRKEGSVNNFV